MVLSALYLLALLLRRTQALVHMGTKHPALPTLLTHTHTHTQLSSPSTRKGRVPRAEAEADDQSADHSRADHLRTPRAGC
jgi:hypothetical protein